MLDNFKLIRLSDTADLQHTLCVRQCLETLKYQVVRTDHGNVVHFVPDLERGEAINEYYGQVMHCIKWEGIKFRPSTVFEKGAA